MKETLYDSTEEELITQVLEDHLMLVNKESEQGENNKLWVDIICENRILQMILKLIS